MNTFTRMMQPKIIAIGLLLLFAAFTPARAQTYLVSVSGSTPNLGTVVLSASAPDTVWRIDPSTQAVTKQGSGSAVRLSSNLTRSTVTISCIGSNCGKGTVNVHVGTIGTPQHSARKLTNLTVVMGSATLKSSVTGTDPLAFTIDHIGSSPKTFYVGADFGIAPESAGLGTGQATSGFYVSVATAPSWDQYSGNGTAIATVYRPISISQAQPLDFGTIVKPPSGSGSVVISKSASVQPSIGGGGVFLGAPKRGIITITGEGHASFSVSPSSQTTMNLVGPTTIPITLDTDLVTPNTLSGATGDTTSGSYTFNIGASFTLDASTPSGNYTGSYGITASYN